MICIGNVLFSIPLAAKNATQAEEQNRARAVGVQAALDALIGFVCVMCVTACAQVGTAMFYPLLFALAVQTLILYSHWEKTCRA